MADSIVGASPRRKARLAGAFYLLTFLTGLPGYFVRGAFGASLGLVAGASYIVVTLLFYHIFKPVNRSLSFLAACLSLIGCAIGPLTAVFHFIPRINPLVFFGFYCLLIGYLILRSSFFPRILGVLMVFAGLGWLTFISPQLANHLSPFNIFPGLIGEGTLTVWLLAVGLNDQRWREQATRF
jgi:Domain of unknown function (DUF4386)